MRRITPILKKVSLLIFVIVILFAILMGVLCLLLTFFKTRSQNEQEFHTYKYLRYDPINEEVSVGFMDSKNIMKPDSFEYSYESDLGTHLVVSNSLNDEYKCSGFCSCQDGDESRRNGIKVLTNPLMYLVVTASSSLAILLAKKHFREECSDFYRQSNTCDEDMIIAEVDDCQNFFESTADSESDSSKYTSGHDDITADQTSEGFWDDKEAYTCRGKCKNANLPLELQRQHIEGVISPRHWDLVQRNFNTIGRTQEEFDCSKMEYAEDLAVQKPEDGYESTRPGMSAKADILENIVHEWIVKKLHPYCQENSEQRIELMDRSGRYQAGKTTYSLLSMCVADLDFDETNCVKIMLNVD